MTNGKFIVIEGMEGAGKSSAISVVEQILLDRQIPYITTREPGGTPLAETLRSLIKSTEHKERMTEETELFLLYASRSQLLENRIRPALASGQWVIGDRHDMSSKAYQGGGRQFNENVMDAIAAITLKGFTPDLTIYLDIEPHIGIARARARGALDRIEQEQLSFFERVRNKYCEIAAQDDRIVSIDANQSLSQVHRQITDIVIEFLER